MSFNFAPMASSATFMIKRFGRSLTFTRVTKGSYDPNTGQTTDTTTTYTKYGCTFDYSDQERLETTIQEGDRRVLAEAYDYKVGDKVSLDSETYRIIEVSQIKPGDTNMAVNLQVRK